MDTDKANAAIRNGTMPKVLEAVIERLNPEAMYFTPSEGERSAFFVFDMKEPSQMPSIAEPLFQEFGAKITLQPVMNLDDLQTGLARLTQ
ncbi:MAG: hypothetical protein ACRDPK_06210 [Carbonactinosporaceae bacterium]